MDNLICFFAGLISVIAFYCFRNSWHYRKLGILEWKVKTLENMIYPYISSKHGLEYKEPKRRAGRPPGSKNKKPPGNDTEGTEEIH
jgi:hypothetical protein